MTENNKTLEDLDIRSEDVEHIVVSLAPDEVNWVQATANEDETYDIVSGEIMREGGWRLVGVGMDRHPENQGGVRLLYARMKDEEN